MERPRLGEAFAPYGYRFLFGVLLSWALVAATASAGEVDKHAVHDCRCWAAQGACEANAAFMSDSCAESCARERACEAGCPSCELAVQTEAKTAAGRIAKLEEQLALQRKSSEETAIKNAKETEQRLRESAARAEDLELQLERLRGTAKAQADTAAARALELEAAILKITELEKQLALNGHATEEATAEDAMECSVSLQASVARADDIEKELNRIRTASKVEVDTAATKVSELRSQLALEKEHAEATHARAAVESVHRLQEKESRIADLELQVKRQRKHAESDSKVAVARIADLEAQLEVAKQTAANATREAAQQVEAVDAQSKAVETRKDELELELMRLQVSANQSSAEVTSAKARSAELEAQVAELQETAELAAGIAGKQLEASETKIKDIEAQLSRQHNSSQAESRAVETRIAELQAQIVQLRETADQKSADGAHRLEVSGKKVKDLEAQLSQQQESAEAQAKAADAKILDLEVSLARMQVTVDQTAAGCAQEHEISETKAKELEEQLIRQQESARARDNVAQEAQSRAEVEANNAVARSAELEVRLARAREACDLTVPVDAKSDSARQLQASATRVRELEAQVARQREAAEGQGHRMVELKVELARLESGGATTTRCEKEESARATHERSSPVRGKLQNAASEVLRESDAFRTATDLAASERFTEALVAAKERAEMTLLNAWATVEELFQHLDTKICACMEILRRRAAEMGESAGRSEFFQYLEARTGELIPHLDAGGTSIFGAAFPGSAMLLLWLVAVSTILIEILLLRALFLRAVHVARCCCRCLLCSRCCRRKMGRPLAERKLLGTRDEKFQADQGPPPPFAPDNPNGAPLAASKGSPLLQVPTQPTGAPLQTPPGAPEPRLEDDGDNATPSVASTLLSHSTLDDRLDFLDLAHKARKRCPPLQPDAEPHTGFCKEPALDGGQRARIENVILGLEEKMCDLSSKMDVMLAHQGCGADDAAGLARPGKLGI